MDQLQPLNQGLELSHPMKYEVYIMVNRYPVNYHHNIIKDNPT